MKAVTLRGYLSELREQREPKSFQPATIFPADEHGWNRIRKGVGLSGEGRVSITELDKVLVTSDTSEIAVYGGCSGRRGPDVNP
ncbi:hypothetical protein MTP99_015538 [Tenebrio molitor]|jgi:hypothetical protein|nr:hypothetical protein MTP99_015538 [Tenebrio molitor]